MLVLVIVAFGYLSLTRDSTNARVAEEVHANPDGERGRKTMLLWLEDGRMYPVNFLHEGNQVFIGIDGLWWREFKAQGQPVKMLIRGKNYSGHAVARLDDPAYKADIFSRLRPTAPEWLPDFLNGKLVVITLDPA